MITILLSLCHEWETFYGFHPFWMSLAFSSETLYIYISVLMVSFCAMNRLSTGTTRLLYGNVCLIPLCIVAFCCDDMSICVHFNGWNCSDDTNGSAVWFSLHEMDLDAVLWWLLLIGLLFIFSIAMDTLTTAVRLVPILNTDGMFQHHPIPVPISWNDEITILFAFLLNVKWW